MGQPFHRGHAIVEQNNVMTDNYEIVIRFDDESPSFVHGFESGMIWAAMEAGASPISRMVHTDIAVLLQRMAENHGYILSMESISDGWINATFQKIPYRMREAQPQ